jgi:hypothetical protein
MKKKNIKIFFDAIRHKELETVQKLVTENKEYLTVCNFAPPKKDDGQSGLQVAFKTGKFEIAEFLIEQGADVNFIEQSEINEWKAPVFHDCIRAVIFNCRTMQKKTGVFDFAFSLLNEMLKKGANPNAVDSHGNTCLGRAILDAKQMTDHPFFEGETSWAGEGLTDEERNIVLNQIRSVFKSLIDAGADPDFSDIRRKSAKYDIVNFRLDKYNLL